MKTNVKFVVFLASVILVVSYIELTSANLFRFDPGDTIKCQAMGRNRGESSQWFLGSFNNKVISIEKSARNHFKVVEREWDEVKRRQSDGNFESSCISYAGPESSAPDEAVDRALEFKRKSLFYDARNCNSEHWVKFWSTGVRRTVNSRAGCYSTL